MTSPNARVAVYPSTDGVVWTSSRVCVACRGKIIELQILVANPECGTTYKTSELISRTQYSIHAANVKAATQDLIKTIVQDIVGDKIESAAEKMPNMGGVIVTGVKVMNWLETFVSGLNTSTIIEKLDTTYIINQCEQTKMVYAKYLDSSDSYQILAYMGNKSNITIEASEPPVYFY